MYKRKVKYFIIVFLLYSITKVNKFYQNTNSAWSFALHFISRLATSRTRLHNQHGVPLRWPLPHQRTSFHSTLNPPRLWISLVSLHGSACDLTHPPSALPTLSAKAAYLMFNLADYNALWLFFSMRTNPIPTSLFLLHHSSPCVLSFTILHHLHSRNT